MTKSNLKEAPAKPLPTPSLDDAGIRSSYTVGRGETGVLSFEPYKSLILPYWAFKTVEIATNSAKILWDIFVSYYERGDFVGADMTRKFIQMGMTRARRYANHKGGRKYGRDGSVLDRWTDMSEGEQAKRKEKEEASEIFKRYWRDCTRAESYKKLRAEWSAEQKPIEKRRKLGES